MLTKKSVMGIFIIFSMSYVHQIFIFIEPYLGGSLNIKQKINSVIQRGLVEGLEFHRDELHIREKNTTFQSPVKLKKEDITFFSYNKSQPFMGIEFLGIRTTKGSFNYQSESMERYIYFKMLEFLGVERLKYMRRRVIIFQLLFASMLFACGFYFYYKGWGSLYSLLNLFGALNLVGAIYNFLIIRKHIHKLLDFKIMN